MKQIIQSILVRVTLYVEFVILFIILIKIVQTQLRATKYLTIMERHSFDSLGSRKLLRGKRSIQVKHS